MKKVTIPIFIISLILFCQSCDEKQPPFQDWFESNYTISEVKDAIENRFSNADTFNICHSEYKFFDTLFTYYSNHNFEPIFINNILDSVNIDTLLYYFSKAPFHGIPESSFDVELIRHYRDEIIRKSINDSIIDYNLLASLELTCANACMKYSHGMQYGIINPKEIFPRNYFLPNQLPDSSNYFKVLAENDIGLHFRTIAPKSERYKKLQKSLIHYKNLKEKGGWDTVHYSDPDIKIEFGDTLTILDSIAKRLFVTGELDTVYQDMQFHWYDSTLFKAVKYYQKINGLLSDGIIGKRTLEQMNVSVDDRIQQICINLERFRWLNYPDTGQVIVVNIPEYHFYAFQEGALKLDMKVCVGEKRDKNYEEKLKKYFKTKKKYHKPNNHETPCLYGQFSYFVINPKWLVPKSIAEKETIYKILKDSSYLVDQQFQVLLDGEEIDPDTIDWEYFSDRKIPFRFRQKPGRLNALGKMKFIFRNKFDIYLHDTPSQAKFMSSYRAVSHGCVRIEKPMAFAEFLIENNEKLEVDDIRLILGLKPLDKEDKKKYKKRKEKYKEIKEAKEEDEWEAETKTIFLKEKVPVYIDYYTSWVDSNNVLQLRQDAYKKDKHVWEAILGS